MTYITVVPALRTPFGVDAFDYRVPDGADVRVGDLLRVPFRKREIPALVTGCSRESAFADRTVEIRQPTPLVRFPTGLASLLERSGARAFVSRPTVLHSWLRTVPKRLQPITVEMHPSQSSLLTDEAEWVVDRTERLVHRVRGAKGRILILCPWRSRAERLAATLSCPVLHADLADGAAWRAWTGFLASSDGVLVATRIGAWLSASAGMVIIEEPENDDFKSDELAPRLDARWVVDAARSSNPSLQVVRIGTTPPLGSDGLAPDIGVKVAYAPFAGRATSDVEGLSIQSVMAIDEAVEAQRPVTVIHPIHGDRSRIACADCSWIATCASCGFGLSRVGGRSRCNRCGTLGDVALACPSCNSTNLVKGRVGRDSLAGIVLKRFGEAVRVVDLPTWHSETVERGALVVLTDLGLIGGVAEDVRRRERLVIAWRRLTADIADADASIIVQGDDELLLAAQNWCTKEGVAAVWRDEMSERATFSYPPARTLVKVLVDGPPDAASTLVDDLTMALGEAWTVRGPAPIAFRPSSRTPRSVIHAIPPKDLKETAIHAALEPFARRAIIDLDPIAFFV
ncbi:MAG: hypothetical protein V1745_05080 [Patescibacteria group bacterium]